MNIFQAFLSPLKKLYGSELDLALRRSVSIKLLGY